MYAYCMLQSVEVLHNSIHFDKITKTTVFYAHMELC